MAAAALSIMPSNPKNFNVDNVRVVKIMGGSLAASKVVQGMVFGREPEGQHIPFHTLIVVLFFLRYVKKGDKRQSSSVHMSFGHFTNGDERNSLDQQCG